MIRINNLDYRDYGVVKLEDLSRNDSSWKKLLKSLGTLPENIDDREGDMTEEEIIDMIYGGERSAYEADWGY